MAATHRCFSRRVSPVKLGNDMPTEVRQGPIQEVHGRWGAPSTRSGPTGGCSCAPGDTPSDGARDRLSTVFATDDATGKLRPAWLVASRRVSANTLVGVQHCINRPPRRSCDPEVCFSVTDGHKHDYVLIIINGGARSKLCRCAVLHRPIQHA